MNKVLIDKWKAEEIEPFSGWDFTYLDGRIIDDSVSWNYNSQIIEELRKADSVLDLGTGGGEKLLELKAFLPKHTCATEGYKPNLILSQDRLKPLGIIVKESNSCLDEILPYKDNEFSLVINRHTAFNIKEIERVLKPGGIFITQQVDGMDMDDFSNVFGFKQPWPFFNMNFMLDKIKETNLTVVTADEWVGKRIFKDVGAIVYFSKAIPWIVPENFSVENYKDTLFLLQDKITNGELLEFTQKRFLLKVRK